MIDFEEQLTLEEEACFDKIEHHIHKMKMEHLAFQECIQSGLAKVLAMLENQNKILDVKIQESTTTTPTAAKLINGGSI